MMPPTTPPEMFAHWAIGRVQRVQPADTGTNNASYLVDAEGGRFFLRIYRNSIDRARLDYEHAVMQLLQKKCLSFAVPAPLVTDDGATTVTIDFDGRETIASLFPRIEGIHAVRGDMAQAAMCGRALAELDGAFARIEGASLPPCPGFFGDLADVHPLVPDPLAVVEEIPASAEQRARVVGIFERLDGFVRHSLGSLPRQVIHGDFGGSNVLLVGDRVSGILDFEFVEEGFRAMDLAVGLWAFGRPSEPSGDPWPATEAFARGYLSKVALEDSEIAALPDLQRLREAASLVHWVGRHRLGLTAAGDIAERVERLLNLDERMHRDGLKLIQRVHQNVVRG